MAQSNLSPQVAARPSTSIEGRIAALNWNRIQSALPRFLEDLNDSQSLASQVVEANAKRARTILEADLPNVIAGDPPLGLAEELALRRASRLGWVATRESTVHDSSGT